MTPPPPPSQHKETDSYQRVVTLMHGYGAGDDREAHEAARNLIGFAQLAMNIRRRRQNQ